jgi:hypothetical protein
LKKQFVPHKKEFNKVFQHRSGASRLHSTVCK